MNDWQSLETQARQFLKYDFSLTINIKQKLLREQNIDIKSCKYFMKMKRNRFTTAYGLVETRNGTELWYFYSKIDENVQIYPTWLEYHEAFSEEDVENLRNIGIFEEQTQQTQQILPDNPLRKKEVFLMDYPQ